MELNQANIRNRIYSIDILRGSVMIIMALDHVRDFFHETASIDSPTNLATTTIPLFFTRWITHFCAPTFVFLAGVSAYLSGLKRSKADLSLFLIKRGFWLVFIEISIVSLAWTFNPFFNVFILQVIWAIGISMIILGIFVRFPYRVILISALLIICFHNMLDYPEAAANGKVNMFWNFLHYGRFSQFPVAKEHIALIVYAFLPWTGIMLLGYAFGRIFSPGIEETKRRKFLLVNGFALLLMFIILRYLNSYGDPAPWSTQKNPVFTFLSFLNVTKYPPSLMYICMTIGPAMIALSLLERMNNPFTRVVSIYGRVPFFYYILHLYLIHLITLIFFLFSGYESKDIPAQHVPFWFRPDRFGFGLPVVYGIWLFVVIALYPLCKWYNRYKSTHGQWWLSYL